MKIVFIRHGQTTGDVEDRYGGDYDDHLSQEGILQSQNLAQELKDKGVEALYISPLIRAKETAQILSKTLNCSVLVEPDLRERNQYGILTGMVKAEAKEKHPELVEKLKDKYNTIDGAESYEDFSTRIQGVLKMLLDSSTHQTIGILWHGGPMRVLFRDYLKWGELKELGDCSWIELEKTGDQFVKQEAGRISFDF
jgi:broad specificity phosphatase PhoE